MDWVIQGENWDIGHVELVELSTSLDQYHWITLIALLGNYRNTDVIN